MDGLEIACSADEGYLPHVSAMLESLLTQTQARPLRVWLTHGPPLSAEGRARVCQVVEGHGARIEFIQIPDAALAGYSLKKFHPACWYRILLPNLLPQLDRILYLDADMIVADDLLPLWSVDLGDKLFAAVDNPLYPFMRNWVRLDLGVIDPLEYPNSGVLLMDLAHLRAERLPEQLREYSTRHPDQLLPEQDALACVARGRWLRLHPRWNLQTVFYEVPIDRLGHPRRVIEEAMARPAIIHFAGWFKPWQYANSHPRTSAYFEHLARTPWPRRPLEQDGLIYRLLRPLPPFLQYRVLLRRERWRALVNRARSLGGTSG